MPSSAPHFAGTERCRAAEEKILQVQQMLREPTKLDLCRAELAEIIAILEPLLTAGPWSQEERASFRAIRESARVLRAQIDHASNLTQGWLQLWMGTGYTEQGQPVFFNREGSVFEG